MLKINSKSINYLQSCITAISFPRTLEDLEHMIDKNIYNYPFINFHTDLDLLITNDLNHDRDEGYWTAPKWMTEGDILFYYYTVRSEYWSKRLLREHKDHIDEIILQNLEHAVEMAEIYSGKILACSEIAGPPEDLGYQDQHFKSTIFAPTKDVYLFENPLDIKDFTEFVKISHGTITPISSNKSFQGIKNLLSEENDLPEYLKNAKIGNNVFKNVNQKNWKHISCSLKSTFIHEDQIRSYLIDYFLKEIKDYRTPMLEECNCFRKKKNGRTGTVDYFIKINSKWIPVEAKINILAERDINGQLSKYININSFKPTKGTNRGKEYEDTLTNFCLVIDQSGVYTFFENDFLDCCPGEPLWHRHEMVNTKKIRSDLIDILKDII